MFFLASQDESSRFCEGTPLVARYTLIAPINAGNGIFPFVSVQFSKTHQPIPIAGATFYLRPSGGARTPLRIGKHLAAAPAAL